MKSKILILEGDNVRKEINLLKDSFVFFLIGKNYYSVDTSAGKMYLNNPLGKAHAKLVTEAKLGF